MHRRLAAAATLCATLLLAACTQPAPQPPPPPSPGPSMPADPPTSAGLPTPTPSVPSPASSEHADLLKVQSIYRAVFAAENDVLQRGGADSLPASIRERTTGEYQRDALEELRTEKRQGERLIVPGKLLGISDLHWTAARITLHSCEDYSGLKSVDKNGRRIKRNPGVRAVQTITAVKRNGAWLIEASDARVVKSMSDEACNGKWYS